MIATLIDFSNRYLPSLPSTAFFKDESGKRISAYCTAYPTLSGVSFVGSFGSTKKLTFGQKVKIKIDKDGYLRSIRPV